MSNKTTNLIFLFFFLFIKQFSFYINPRPSVLWKSKGKNNTHAQTEDPQNFIYYLGRSKNIGWKNNILSYDKSIYLI